MARARIGKIATLPAAIREEVNRRIYDAEPGTKIIAWLQSQPEVLQVLEERWNGEPISSQNLSEWRAGGYADWLERRERVEALKVLSDYSLRLAKAAGGSISEGAAAIAGGKVLELLETAASGDDSADIESLVSSLTALRSAEIAQKKLDQHAITLQQRDRALALEEQRFQRQTAEMFMKFYEDKRAREIAEGKASKTVKMDKLVQLFFGARPETSTVPTDL